MAASIIRYPGVGVTKRDGKSISSIIKFSVKAGISPAFFAAGIKAYANARIRDWQPPPEHPTLNCSGENQCENAQPQCCGSLLRGLSGQITNGAVFTFKFAARPEADQAASRVKRKGPYQFGYTLNCSE